MTKIKETNEKATIIDGVVLTEKALKELEFVQNNDNDMLDSHCNNIADAICFLAKESDTIVKKEETTDIMISLAYVRDFLQKIRKP